jgi:hypothetical protein
MGSKHKNSKLEYCEWCGKKTDNEPTQVAETPILEDIEQEIDSYPDRDQVWGVGSDWSELNLSSTFEAKLMVYDEMLNKISMKVICKECLEHDEMLYERYYPEEIIFTFDPEVMNGEDNTEPENLN